MSLVAQCQRCGAPAHLRCSVCGRTLCTQCLDSEERICAECAGIARTRRGLPSVKHPPSRRA